MPVGTGATVYPSASGGGVWQPPSIEALQRMLPQYEFIAMLGAGGMGAVYKARQVSLDRLVAIKILPPGLNDGSGANFTERFKQEARTMAKMSHPCIVSVHDFGQTSEGQFYFVMEFIEGTDVQKLIRENRKLKPEDALAITSHVCDALEYAHSRGVIHRDIKPANVLISAEGTVKIADFGLAKAVDNKSHELTRSNIAMGTPHFMAPETMYADVKVDARADLYAVGVMLYNMITGEIPTGMFKLPSKKVGCDTRFDEIVKKAMEPDRDERYQHASEIRHDLDTILTTPVVHEGDASIPVVVPAEMVRGQKIKTVTDSVVATLKKQESAKVPHPKEGAVKVPADHQHPIRQAPAFVPPKHVPPPSSPGLGKIVMMMSAAVIVVTGIIVWSPWNKREASTTPQTAPDGAKKQIQTSTAPTVVKNVPAAPVSGANSREIGAGVKFSPSSEPWVDALGNPGLLQLGGGTARTSDGLLAGKDGSTFTQLNGPDYAVRMIVASAAADQVPKIQLRDQGGSNYMILVRPDHVSVARYVAKKALSNIAHLPVVGAIKAKNSYELEARIVGSTISISIDGVVIGSVEDSTFPAGGVSIGNEFDNPVLLRAVQYLDLSASGTSASPTSASSNSLGKNPDRVPDSAEPGAIRLWSTKDTLTENEHVQWVDDEKAVRILGGSIRLAAPVPPSRDGILRASIRLNEEKGVAHLRLRCDGAKDLGFCALVINAGGRKFDLATRDGIVAGDNEFKRIPFPAGFKPAEWNQYELRVVGDEWTVFVNGQKLDSVRNSTRTSPGVPMITGIYDAFFRDVVFTPLDSSAAAPKQTFDLLALTDPVRDRGASPSLIGANTWEKSGGVLTYMSDGKAGKIAAPVSLNARDYEIEVAFRRATADDRFHLDLPLSSNRVIPVIFGSSRTNVIVPGDIVIGSSPAFASALTGRVALRVRPAGGDASSITITLDGAPAGFWTGKLDRIGWKIGGKNPAFPGEPVTSLYCAGTDYSFTSWTLRVFDGEARLLRPSTTTSESRATTAGWISLMDKIDPASDALANTWNRKPDGISCDALTSPAKLQLPYEPPEEYDFRIAFTSDEGTPEAIQILSARGNAFCWTPAGDRASAAAFFEVGGKSMIDSPARAQLPARAKLHQRYESLVEVRRDRVTGHVDGRKMLEWKTDYSDMKVWGLMALRDARHIGIGLYATKATIHDISVREVTGAGKILR